MTAGRGWRHRSPDARRAPGRPDLPPRVGRRFSAPRSRYDNEPTRAGSRVLRKALLPGSLRGPTATNETKGGQMKVLPQACRMSVTTDRDAVDIAR